MIDASALVQWAREQEALRACPFCGAVSVSGDFKLRVIEQPSGKGPMYLVRCEVCRTEGPIATSSGSAAALWNQRPLTKDEGNQISLARQCTGHRDGV